MNIYIFKDLEILFLLWNDDDENLQLNLIETKVNFKHENRHKNIHTHTQILNTHSLRCQFKLFIKIK